MFWTLGQLYNRSFRPDYPKLRSIVAVLIVTDSRAITAGRSWYQLRQFEECRICVFDQVYKAKLIATGEMVAVKVQRPRVLATVTRDLYVIRIILDLLGYDQQNLHHHL